MSEDQTTLPVKLRIYDESRRCVRFGCNTHYPAKVELMGTNNPNSIVLRTCMLNEEHKWLEFPRTAADEMRKQS
jgi:hypothetical protein